MARKTILFDLDGTLWHSYPLYACVAERLTRVSAAEVLLRLQNGESIVSMMVNRGVDRNTFIRHCVDQVGELQLYEGVHQTLMDLRTNNVGMGVVTSLPKWLAEPLLSELELTTFFSATEFRARKPSPTAILSAMRVLDSQDGEVCYVGDTTTDAEAARRAGVRFGWAAYGYGPEQPSSSSFILNNFRGVLDI